MGIAEGVFHFLQFRRAAQLHGVIAALDREGELFAGVNADDIKASISKGVLSVTVPKPAPAQVKKIQIKVAA